MFARAHHVPDPTSSSTLAKFPLLGLSCASERLHIFPRLFTAFYSTIPVDVVRVKSHTNCLFDSVRVVIRVTNNKLYFVPGWLVSGVVSIL